MPEEQKKGFSYESPEKQRKGAAKVLVFEVTMLIVVIVGIVGALIFLNVIPYPDFGQKNKTINQSNSGDNLIKGRNSLTPPLEQVMPTFSATSEVSTYTLRVDEDKIIDQLQNWYIYGRTYSDGTAGSTNGKYLSNINVHLTNKEQPIFKLRDEEGVYVGSGYKFEDETLNLFIYVAPRRLSDNKDEGNYLFNKQVLFSLRALGLKVNTPQQYGQVLKEVGQIVDQQRDSKLYYISIE